MYVRPPNQTKENIRIPDNYSGNAFSGGQLKSASRTRDIPREDYLQKEYMSPPYAPHAQGEPTSRNENSRANDGDEEFSEAEREDAPSLMPEVVDTVSDGEKEKRASLLSSLLPSGLLKNNFPFGHGIGSEEILIMTMMFLVFNSGNEENDPDTELILLLALLLFAG